MNNAVPDRMAVVDVETTGFGNLDRVIEVAVVCLDREFQIIDEYDTLVNPERDVGRTDIHGISPSVLSAAPTFSEIAAALSRHLDGAVMVAHNLPFDARMLRNEFQRFDSQLDPGHGICTLRLCGEKLAVACERFGIRLTEHHRALADARATAELLRATYEPARPIAPAAVRDLNLPFNPRTLRRESGDGCAASVMTRIVSHGRYPACDDEDELVYLQALDWVLDDLIIEADEMGHLQQLAAEFGFSPGRVEELHFRYFRSLVVGARRDGIITAQEHRIMEAVAQALGISAEFVPAVTAEPSVPDALAPGTRICFTGTAIGPDGGRIEKAQLHGIAAASGLQPVADVTKKCCDLLVAADAASNSGKAKKARRYGIPVMAVAEFLKLLPQSQ